MVSPARYIGLKRMAVGGALAAALLLLPRIGVMAFFWWDARRVRLPAWMSTRVLWELGEFYSPPDAARWLRSSHPLLDDLSPADVLEAGGEDRVLALIEQLTTGAYA